MLFLVWYDTDAGRPLAEKVQAALGAYSQRFKAAANLVLVNEVDLVTIAGIEVRGVRTVQPNHFWVGLTLANDPDPIPS
jgi:predicted component of type VI protein secretion system